MPITKNKPQELSIVQKKEWAQMLFLQGTLSQKEIAHKVKITEKTFCEWKKKENWERLRKSLLTTKAETLRFFYDVLDNIKSKIKSDKNKIGDTKLADMVVKYTAAIKALESDTSIAQLMEAGVRFHKYMQLVDPQKALEFLNNYDGFIKDNLKKFHA